MEQSLTEYCENFTYFKSVTIVYFTNLQDPEPGVEVEEDLALDDRKLPLAYNHLRHQESICGVENESQVCSYKKNVANI